MPFQCERNSAALLPYVGTPNAARDMDVLRAALGESRLTYLGKSYGTYLGAWYAQLFPHRVRALVLDGAVDPARPRSSDLAQAEGFQGAFGSFAAWCLAAPGCPLGRSVAGAEAKVEALIARANSAPLANRLGDGQVADGALLLYGVADALYSRSYWPPGVRAGERVHRRRDRAPGAGRPVLRTQPQRDLQHPGQRRHRHRLPGPALAAFAGPLAVGGGDRRAGRADVRRGPRLGQPGLRLLAGPVLPAAADPGRGRAAHPGRRHAARSGHALPVGRRWRATYPPACCSAGTSTATPPTARAAPAWIRSSTTT